MGGQANLTFITQYSVHHRLGVAVHFVTEIGEMLACVYSLATGKSCVVYGVPVASRGHIVYTVG